ncbi:MAG: hypothetical protein ACOYMG_06925, partial [Candidatus Methylumidiphilus sp.]
MRTLTNYLPLYGKWTREQENIVFTGVDSDPNHGLALFGYDLEDGEIEAEIKLSGSIGYCGAMIVFRANGQERYYAAGIGGSDNAYSLIQGSQLRSTKLIGVGSSDNIEADRTYKLKIVLEGQKVDLFVDSIKVISFANLPRQTGSSVGLFCFKPTARAIFGNYRVNSSRPKAFVAMQFSEPYNEVYRDAVEPLVKEIGFEPLRVD